MDRRRFHQVCGSLLAGAAALSQRVQANQQSYSRCRLLSADGNPLRYSGMAVGTCHVFHYPYQSTPCFLIRLEPGVPRNATLTDRAGQRYVWAGGVGPDHALVAFSAICSHKMTHPAKPISHLNFRSDEREFYQRDGKLRRQSQLITCCSEYSVYDPGDGARVLSGPATEPLATITLEVNDDTIVATGSIGGDQYQPFLQKFGLRQALELGLDDPAQASGESTLAILAELYSHQMIRC